MFQGTAFGGERFDKVLNGIKCQGHEQHLYECYHEQVNEEVECDERSMVAGVICTNREYCLSVCVSVCVSMSRGAWWRGSSVPTVSTVCLSVCLCVCL